MNISVTLVLSTILLASTVPATAQGRGTAYTSSQTAQLQITQKTDAPGLSLSPGTYSIRISDRLNDRIIVQVQKMGAKNGTSFLAYPNPGLRGGSFTGPITFASGIKGKPALRGFGFAGGPVVEFVYPKADAVTLAKSNDVRVMAIDPASEGRVSLPNLTQADMTEVTLWMLTPTPVDPATAKPGIQAARYQAPASDQADASGSQLNTPAQPTVSAQASYLPQGQSSAVAAAHSGSVRPAPRSAVQVASNNHPPRLRPKVQELPHTASNLPLLSVLGLLSFMFGGVLTLRRGLLNRI